MAKLLRLLTEGDTEQRTAAAIVIGELVPDDPDVVGHLSRAASHDDLRLRTRAIEALGKIGTAEAREALYPFLDAEGEVRDAAIAAVSRTGNAALPHIKAAFPEAPPPKKRTLLKVLSAIATRESIQLLLAILQEPHATIVSDAVMIFREETGALESRNSRALAAQIRTAFGKKDFLRNRDALEAAVQMLTHLRDPRSASLLLGFTAPSHPPNLRRSALLGLRWVLPQHRGRDEAVHQLLGYLEEDDFQSVVAPALEALQPLPVPRSAADVLIKLAESRHPLVRKFALSKMSDLNQPQVVQSLISALSDSDPMIRELATRSLQAQSGAWRVVADALETCTDVDLAWRMVSAVRADAKGAIDDESSKATIKRAIARLESHDPIAEPMLSLVQTISAEAHFKGLYQRALHWKRKQKYAEAELCLRELIRNETCTDEAKFEFAIVSLKNSAAAAGSIARDSDVPLAVVKRLIKDASFPLLKRLQAEKDVLDPGDYYYLGFHLIEGTPGERTIGAELLRRLVAATPHSRVGRSAKSKLRIEGLL